MTAPAVAGRAAEAAEAGLRATEADRAALAEVLGRPEFRDRLADGLALRRLLLGWWDRLLALLETPEAERYASLGRLVFFVAAGAAVALAWRAARRRRAAGAARRRPTGEGAAEPGTAPPDPAAGLAGAERALRAGDLAGAVRAAYGAAAAALARTGRSAGPAGGAATRTGPELAAESGDPRFAALARLHDRTVFGRRPVAPDEAAASVEAAQRLVEGARDAHPAGPARPGRPSAGGGP